MKRFTLIAFALLAMAGSQTAGAVDARAAQNELRKDKCLTCHAVDRQKDGPSYKEIAAEYKGKPDAEAQLTKHVTVPSTVEVEGNEEEHGTLSSSDPDVIKNVVHWIMSL